MTKPPDTKKSAVVFGASGLVGKEILTQLSGNKDFGRIVAVVRNKSDNANPRLEQVSISDFSRLMDLKDKLDAGAYFCCIGTTIKKVGSREAFLKVDHDIPEKIAQLAEALHIPAMVIISSMGANSRSANFYLRTKGTMEKTVRKTYSGNLKFVRPSLLMGKREEFRLGEKIAVSFMKAFGWLFAGPLRKYKGIYASDVARAMIKISQSEPDKTVYESNELFDILSK